MEFPIPVWMDFAQLKQCLCTPQSPNATVALCPTGQRKIDGPGLARSSAISEVDQQLLRFIETAGVHANQVADIPLGTGDRNDNLPGF